MLSYRNSLVWPKTNFQNVMATTENGPEVGSHGLCSAGTLELNALSSWENEIIISSNIKTNNNKCSSECNPSYRAGKLSTASITEANHRHQLIKKIEQGRDKSQIVKVHGKNTSVTEGSFNCWRARRKLLQPNYSLACEGRGFPALSKALDSGHHCRKGLKEQPLDQGQYHWSFSYHHQENAVLGSTAWIEKNLGCLLTLDCILFIWCSIQNSLTWFCFMLR